MDAFKNYQALMSGIGENIQGQAENAKKSALFNAKSRTDDIVKTLGEAKVFISGKPLMAKVGKVLKAKLKERMKPREETSGEAAERRMGATDKEYEDYFKEPVEPPTVNAEVVPNNAGPSRLDALRDKIAQREKDAQKAKDDQQAQKDADDAAERRGAKDKDASGEEETFEMKDIGGGTGDGQEITNRAFDPTELDGDTVESNLADAAGGGGDIATGLEGGFNVSSDPVFSSVMSQTRGGNLQNPFANARQNKFNPQQEDGQSNSTPRSQPAEPETQPTADAPTSGSQAGVEAGGNEASIGGGAVAETDIDAASAAAKSVAEAAAKSAAEKAAGSAAAKLGGEEAGAGVLDAIPGADVIGLVVGGIMAAVAAHKAHKAEKDEENMAPAGNNTTISFQAGIGDD